MSNELLFIISALAGFSMVLLFFRVFKEKGIFAWVAMSSVIVNIEALKCCNMFGMAVTLGNVLYGSMFLCTDILSELYGKKQARQAIIIGFFALAASTIMMQLSLLFTPNETDFASPAFHTLFSLSPRICFCSICCYLISNSLDIRLYEWFSKLKFPIWLKNNSATFISQIVDTIAFTFAAFYGLFPIASLWELVATTLIIKIFVALIDTPFLYAATLIAKKYHAPKANK